LCKSREFPYTKDASLLIVAINHIKEVGIAVVVCNTNGQKLLPILMNNKNTNLDVLVVHSLSVKEIDHATSILEMSPYRLKLVLPSQEMLPKLEKSVAEFLSKYSVHIQTSVSYIIIQGYVEKYVIAIYNKLLEKIEDLTLKTTKLDLSKEELQFLNHIMYIKPTKKATQILSMLSKSLSIKVKNSPVSIEFTGTSKAIADGKQHIIQELLKSFQVQTVSSRCHPNFLSQIDMFVRKPLEDKFEVVVYCFQVHGSERFTHGNLKTVIMYTKVYSTDNYDFKRACEIINVSTSLHIQLLYLCCWENCIFSACICDQICKKSTQHSKCVLCQKQLAQLLHQWFLLLSSCYSAGYDFMPMLRLCVSMIGDVMS